MPIFSLFSKRNRPRPATLAYDEIPPMLRGFCVDILNAGLGTLAHEAVDRILIAEHPRISFRPTRVNEVDALFGRARQPRVYEDCLNKGNFDEAMDAVEAGMYVINTDVREAPDYLRRGSSVSLEPDDAIKELNARFVESGVGYQFSPEQNQVVRVDSEFLHVEVTQPAMALLMEQGFDGAAQEFHQAHQAYRESAADPERGKEAVRLAVNAVESTAKAIMDQRHWSYGNKDTIVPLLDKLFTKGLVPEDFQSYFAGLRTALCSGLPNIGNSRARHGQGAKPKAIEQHIVTLAMHLTAATIRFLVEAHRAMGTP